MNGLQSMPTPQQYLRWGLPSLILAGTSLVIFLLSECIVQPRIAAHYRSLSERSMQWIVKNDNQIIATGNDKHPQSDVEKKSLDDVVEAQLKAVKSAEILQKRLALFDPSGSEPYWTAGLAAEYGASACLRLARNERITGVASTDAKDDWSTRSLWYRNRAIEAYSRAARRQGSTKGQATVRLQQLALEHDLPALSDQTLAIHEKRNQLEALKSSSSDTVDIGLLENQLDLVQALNPLDRISDEDRKAIALSVNERFAGLQPPKDVIEQAWKLDVSALLEPEGFLTQARETLAMEWKRNDASEARLPARADAIYRMMIPLMGVDEAFQYVRSRSQELALIEVPQLKNLVAWSSIRFMQANKSFPDSVYARVDFGRLLKELVLFSSESASVMDILESLLMDREETHWAIWDEAFKTVDGSEVKTLAAILRNTLDRTGIDDSDSLKNSDPRLVAAFLPILAHLASKGDVQYSDLIFVLNRLQESHPSVPDIQFMRAVMASKHGDLDQAIEDFTELNQKFPGNRSVVSILERLQMQNSSGR